MLSGKWRLFCLSLNELHIQVLRDLYNETTQSNAHRDTQVMEGRCES